MVFLSVYVYLALSSLYLFVLALAGRWAKDNLITLNAEKKKIAVLIPAYKEDQIIVETAKLAASHNYPAGFFQVIVIADSLKNETIAKLGNVPVTVLEVQFNISTKAKSLHAALAYLKNDRYEIVIILDADNVMAGNFLENINGVFHQAGKAFQCHRSAKNQDTPIAILDAISEEININLFRRGPAAMGLSSRPLGSGMAFQTDLLVSIFDTANILNNPAEDREIEIQLMMRSIRMEYLDNVLLYDEKVADPGVFQKQRTRWLEAQLNHARRFFKQDMKSIPKTADYYNILFQTLLLPRLLYLIVWCMVILILTVKWIFKISFVYPSSVYWVAWMITYFVVLLISIPPRYYNIKTLGAIAYIPVLMLSMLKAVFKLKKNRKEFLHTPKTYNDK